jgi:hypothetical protein
LEARESGVAAQDSRKRPIAAARRAHRTRRHPRRRASLPRPLTCPRPRFQDSRLAPGIPVVEGPKAQAAESSLNRPRRVPRRRQR